MTKKLEGKTAVGLVPTNALVLSGLANFQVAGKAEAMLGTAALKVGRWNSG